MESIEDKLSEEDSKLLDEVTNTILNISNKHDWYINWGNGQITITPASKWYTVDKIDYPKKLKQRLKEHLINQINKNKNFKLGKLDYNHKCKLLRQVFLDSCVTHKYHVKYDKKIQNFINELKTDIKLSNTYQPTAEQLMTYINKSNKDIIKEQGMIIDREHLINKQDDEDEKETPKEKKGKNHDKNKRKRQNKKKRKEIKNSQETKSLNEVGKEKEKGEAEL